MRLVIIAVACALLFVCCKKTAKDPLQNTQFAFGTSFNFCVGDCATFYAIQSDKLYPDAIKGQYTGALSFGTNPLANDKYLLAKQLLDSMPAFLLANADTTFGCPDCADGGAIHIWRNVNGSIKHWDIDYQNEGNPVEIQPYVDKLKKIMGDL